MSVGTDIRIFLSTIGWKDVIDVVVVAFVVYQLLKLIRGTQAVQILVGLGVLLLIGFVAGELHLRLLEFLFANASQALIFATIVLFQPELRRALDQVGRLTPVRTFFGHHGSEGITRAVQEVIRAVASLSEKRTGALIVFERETGLENVAATGVAINGEVNAELLATIFYTGSPLHDGAVLVRDTRLVAAGCVLPLADTLPGVGRMGTRHRAALGLTLQADAVVLIVSEETGLISVAQQGKIFRGLDTGALDDMLQDLLGGTPKSGRLAIQRPFLRSAGAQVRSLTRR